MPNHQSSNRNQVALPVDNLNEHRRHKFKIAHEIGHTLMRLSHGGQENYEPYKGETGLLTNNKCTTGDGYSKTTLEYNVVAAEEGFADFYSAIVWNNTNSNTGNLDRFNLESNPIWGDLNRAGGRISCGPVGANCQSGSPHADCCTASNQGCWECCCNPTSTDGKGTRLDWARALWDWHTPTGSSGRASATQIREVWGRMMQDHFNEVSGAVIQDEGDYWEVNPRRGAPHGATDVTRLGFRSPKCGTISPARQPMHERQMPRPLQANGKRSASP
jgi:hypothetical protein